MLYLSSMRILVFLCLIILPIVAQSQARRAQSLIDKNKTEEAYQLLTKELKKDSLASAEKHVLASLFFNPTYANNNLDSAYHYILKALVAYEKTTEKGQSKLANSGFTKELIVQLKKEIESAGFIRAKDGGKEQDYIDFLIEFPTSLQVDSAITLRNIEAFIIAEQTNTYQSYKQFFDTYPQAKEANEARKRYENLLFVNKTKDGKLHTYQQFLIDYPDTWLRKEAEQQIYNIITGRNSIAAYKYFVELYPQSFLRNQAVISQYALLEYGSHEEIAARGNLSTRQRDSLRVTKKLNQQLIIPIIHNNEYQLINSMDKVLTEHIINISDDYKCAGPIPGIILTEVEDTKALITPSGAIITKGDISKVVDEGRGIIKLISSNKQNFMHTGGFKSSNNSFDKASVVWPYIGFQSKTKWGLESITGIPLLAPEYDSIAAFHDHIILKKDRKWGIFPVAHFYPLLDGEKVKIDLSYDNISELNGEHVLLEKGKKSSLLNRIGDVVISMEEQSIELVEDGYFVDRIDSLQDTRVSNTWYYDINYNENWTAGDRGETKEVYYNGQFLMKADEAKILGPSAALITTQDSTFCFFNDSTKILIDKNESILAIGSMGKNSSVRHFIQTKAKKKQIVYNRAGQIVDVGKFNKLIDIGDDYILSRIKKTSILLNDSGKVVLKGIDAATSLDNGYISYLSNQKFGLFNEKDSTLIEAKFNRPLVTYSESLFMTVNENKYGILNRNDSLLVPVNYSNIRYLNDTVALLNNNFRWTFWDIKHSTSLLDNVSDYWLHELSGQNVYKIFKGIGYGIWTPQLGTILNSTFSEISIVAKGEEVVYIAEKWVEEADIVIMLYYNKLGVLFRKEILSTAEYEDLTCKTNQE